LVLCMEYVYAALLLHKLKKEVTEDNVKKIVQSVGVAPVEVKIKALVSALSEVNIDEALKTAIAAQVAPQAATAAPAAPVEKAKEKVEEKKDEKKEEEALAGLSSLFG
jgi:large subunit ribosomal protein L12